MGGIDLTIIVVSYNTRELLRSCLNSVYRTGQGLALEVIAVDNASSDGSAEMVERDFPQVLLLKNDANAGFSRAVNRALTIARGDYILLLNSDVEILPHALQRSLTFLESHPEAGIVGCKLLNTDGSIQSSCESFPEFLDFVFEALFLDKLFSHHPRLGRMHLTFFAHDQVREVDRAKGAFLMIRRRTFEDIGPLDERFFFYSEEADWCYRARQKGWKVYFFPDAEVIHHGGQSDDPLAPHLFVQLHKNRLEFYRKYHGPLESLGVKLVTMGGTLIRLPFWLGIGIYRWMGRRDGVYEFKKFWANWAVLKWHLGCWRPT